MKETMINGALYSKLLEYGALNLASDFERINALNVFPVPDGDTGTNMKMTIEGGMAESKKLAETHIGAMSAKCARAMVLSARGNSGVILSQFFKGISLGLEGVAEVDVSGFAEALNAGTKRAYEVVSNPTEGTVLTVMRVAGEEAIKTVKADSTLEDFLVEYIRVAKETLEKTPDLLPVLKKAGVIDSGGAGFILVMEGMLKAVRGEMIEVKTALSAPAVGVESASTFNADSELTYGYCTEFILQLQNSKVNVKTFDLDIITNFLKEIGNSIVSFKDDDLIKVHVHTFDPGKVLSECRKYGEFITIKIENMNVQHSETNLAEGAVADVAVAEAKEHKKYAVVAVAGGEGIKNSFKELGVDVVVSGGQTMNTSTADFIEAFESIDADNILVFPNNGNIIMAAQAAADNYEKADVFVVPSKTISQGFSAVSMLNFDSDDIGEIMSEMKAAIKNVGTLEVTYSIRDAEIDDVSVKKDDFICLYNDKMISADKDRKTAIKKAFEKIEDMSDKQVMVMFVGKGVEESEAEEVIAMATEYNRYLEVCPVQGEQEVYGYIIGLE